MEKPESLTTEHLVYLDDLRDSGITNMFGAVPFLTEEFPELSEIEARSILKYWMKTYPKDVDKDLAEIYASPFVKPQAD